VLNAVKFQPTNWKILYFIFNLPFPAYLFGPGSGLPQALKILATISK